MSRRSLVAAYYYRCLRGVSLSYYYIKAKGPRVALASIFLLFFLVSLLQGKRECPAAFAARNFIYYRHTSLTSISTRGTSGHCPGGGFFLQASVLPVEGDRSKQYEKTASITATKDKLHIFLRTWFLELASESVIKVTMLPNKRLSHVM